MNRKSGIFLLVVALAGGGYYYYRTQLSCSFLRQEKITIAGKEYPVRPAESLEKIGCTLRKIPDKKNAAILYIEASNVYDDLDILDKSQRALRDKRRYVTGNTWINDRDFTDWFQRNQECLELLHKAAKKPHCEFLVLGVEDDIPAARMLPMDSQMRGFAQLLVCEGKRYEYHKDYSRALDSYLAIAALCEHYHESNPVLITDLVTIACHAVRNDAVETCLANNSLSENDLRKVVKRYERVLKTHPTPVDALKREKYVTDYSIDMAMETPELAWILVLGPRSASARDRTYIAGLIRSSGAELRAAYEQDYDALITWSALPAWQALRPGSDWGAYLSRLPKTSIFSRGLLETLGRSKRQYAKSKAQAGGVLLFAAVKLYEKKNGRPPRALSDLVPDYLRQLPKDPFSGNDYVYKVKGAEWILYSVWDNLTDDNGAGAWPHRVTSDKDLVFWSRKIPLKPPPR